MKSLILYSTIVGGFYAQNESLEAAVSAARARVGNDVWKRGFSGHDPGGATAAAAWALHQAEIKPVVLEGQLVHVGFVENCDDSGNCYPKLRVGLESMDDQFLVSLDLKSDVAQRLLAKLDNCQPGDYIRISAWPTVVTRGGRSFINHAVSVKGTDAKEIPVNADFTAQVRELTGGVEATLIAAGITDKRVVATPKATRRIDAHKELLPRVQKRFAQARANA
jgi:hypothetical protein